MQVVPCFCRCCLFAVIILLSGHLVSLLFPHLLLTHAKKSCDTAIASLREGDKEGRSIHKCPIMCSVSSSSSWLLPQFPPLCDASSLLLANALWTLSGGGGSLDKAATNNTHQAM